jgi:hypothetical protein
MSTNFFKTKPYDHQIEALNRGMNQSSYGYLMEMGTGKSKVLIDNLAGLALQNKVNFALIIAPKGCVPQLGGERDSRAYVGAGNPSGYPLGRQP